MEENKTENEVENNQELTEEEVSVESSDETTVEEEIDPIEKLQNELKECEDKFLRTHAEFENRKRRLEKDRDNAIAYSFEKFITDLLPALDSLELALKSTEQEDADPAELLAKLKEGIDLTSGQFIKTFEKHNVEVISTDEGFDPHLHEGVMQVDSEEHNEGDIVATFQKGYKLKDRVIRPAMVSICK